MMIKTGNRIKGQSLFEVLFAVTISAVVLVAVVALAVVLVRSAIFSRNKALANLYSREVGEWLKQQKNIFPNWVDFHTQALLPTDVDNTWCLVSLTWDSPTHTGTCATDDHITGSTIFTREMMVADQDSGEGLRFVITISWNDSIGLHDSETTVILTNW